MTISLTTIAVPDDSGRDAYTRFRFQAHVAFPACLDCVTEGRVLAVVCEHIEDLLIEQSDVLRFTQIKTRNPDYGPWKFSDLCRVRGGALASILRTHRAIANLTDEREVVYEIRLEGVADRRDPLQQLLIGGEGANDAMARATVRALREATGISVAEARALLSRVRVRLVTLRESIEDENLRKLRALAGQLPANDLKAIYDRAIDLISTAMEGQLLADSWPAVLFEPADESEERAAVMAGKRLDSERLRPVLEPLLDGVMVSIEGFADPEQPETALARKLRDAGASGDLIARAKSLRAAATRREFEVRGRDLTGKAERAFVDLDERLLTAATASAETVGQGDAPAGPVFADLLNRLNAQPEAYDPQSLLARDGLALVGGVCQISDECRFGWRRNA